jgi:hypothetical protein
VFFGVARHAKAKGYQGSQRATPEGSSMSSRGSPDPRLAAKKPLNPGGVLPSAATARPPSWVNPSGVHNPCPENRG